MQRVTCPSCFLRISESDVVDWNKVVVTGKCPKCSTPISSYPQSNDVSVAELSSLVQKQNTTEMIST